ncbi:MAG: PH domain-containing protein [Ruminococcus sp.]|nr:PH domain-containing protein [Ruminococcus sp.]
MYHEHPLRILKYSAKNIWLLIFPLLRGVHAITLDADVVYNWLKGAWIDILIIGLIIVFGFIRWYFSRITVTDEAIVHTDGVFVKVRKAIAYNRLSSVTVERSFYLRPFGGMRVYCDTCAGIFQSSDMKLMVSRKVCTEIMKNVPEVESGDSISYRHKPRLMLVLLFSVFFSSSFSGAVYLAAFFFKGGDIAKDVISVSLGKIAEETSKIPILIVQKIPAAAIGIGSFFLATWFLSFALNMLRYSGFAVKSDNRLIEIVCGTFTRRRYMITAELINYADLQQNLVMKFFKAVTVSISCAGYGSAKNQLPVIFPLKKVNSLSSGLERIGLCAGCKNEFRPRITSIWQYIWSPVITAAAIYPAALIIPEFFPKLAELAYFGIIMAEIPAIWMIFVKTAAAVTSGISIYEDRIMIRYSRWLGFHTVVAERSRLVRMRVTQTPFQRISRKCTVSLYFNGETSKRHFVKAIKISDAEKIAVLLGYDSLAFKK